MSPGPIGDGARVNGFRNSKPGLGSLRLFLINLNFAKNGGRDTKHDNKKHNNQHMSLNKQ